MDIAGCYGPRQNPVRQKFYIYSYMKLIDTLRPPLHFGPLSACRLPPIVEITVALDDMGLTVRPRFRTQGAKIADNMQRTN